jgi:adenylate cyclase
MSFCVKIFEIGLGKTNDTKPNKYGIILKKFDSIISAEKAKKYDSIYIKIDIEGGEEREMTVFFSDIRGFTTISEQTTPTELVRILNEYFTQMTAEVLRTGGVVDKYIGDAVMAFWGAPIDDPDHADHAVEAALAMIEKLKLLNQKLRAQGDPEIKIGIGLYSGKAVVGNVGSNDRFDYTVIGDTVNAASRLEGLNKEYKTQIIISESVKNKLKKQYPLVCLGCTPVKGRKEPINIYTIEGTMMPQDEASAGSEHAHH